MQSIRREQLQMIDVILLVVEWLLDEHSAAVGPHRERNSAAVGANQVVAQIRMLVEVVGLKFLNQPSYQYCKFPNKFESTYKPQDIIT